MQNAFFFPVGTCAHGACARASTRGPHSLGSGRHHRAHDSRTVPTCVSEHAPAPGKRVFLKGFRRESPPKIIFVRYPGAYRSPPGPPRAPQGQLRSARTPSGPHAHRAALERSSAGPCAPRQGPQAGPVPALQRGTQRARAAQAAAVASGGAMGHGGRSRYAEDEASGERGSWWRLAKCPLGRYAIGKARENEAFSPVFGAVCPGILFMGLVIF